MTEALLLRYAEFVDGVTSAPSRENEIFIQRLQELANQNVNIARLVTAGMGLAGESGEVADIIKKVCFHGKPFTEELRLKLKDECSDLFWYIMTLCLSLDIDPVDVIKHNIEKLQTRYPGGKFSVERSENRII